MNNRRNMAGRKELTQSLKHTGMMNYQEIKKLNCSVDKYKKEFEKKLRELSVQQSALLASQRRRESRRGSLPSCPSFERPCGEEDKRNGGDESLKSSFSDSALDQYSVTKDLKSGVNNDNRGKSSPSPLKLPSITTHKKKGSKKIEVEDVTSIKTPKEILFDKMKYSRQAKPRLDALDVTRKLSNGYSAMVIASPPITRSTARRGSLQSTHLSPLCLEEPAPNRTRLMRRGSCPTLGSKWAIAKKLVGLENKDDNSEEQTFTKHVQELKNCRYLRFPTSIKEDEELEEDNDSVFIQK